MKNLVILFSLLLFMPAQAQDGEIFYQRCERDTSGKLKCVPVQGIPFMKYKRTFLKDLRVGNCYRRNTRNKVVFYKITNIKNKTIFALAQAVKQSDIKDFGNKIYVDNYPWNGENFNQRTEEFPCSETPTLGDTAFLTKQCKYKPGETRRRTLYCNPEFRVRTYERKF